jgi:hypothetical protein
VAIPFQLTAATRRLVFSTPGTYTVVPCRLPTRGSKAPPELSISVFNNADFDSFGGNYLTGYTIQSVELRDNYSPEHGTHRMKLPEAWSCRSPIPSSIH